MSTPAQAVEAEQALLGLCLQSPPVLATVRRIVSVGDFYRPAHAVIFGALCDLADQGVITDPIRLLTELEATGQAGKVGGAPYLHTLFATQAVGANADFYAGRVRDATRLRVLAKIAERLTQIAEGGGNDIDAALMHAAHEHLALAMLIDERAHDAPLVGLHSWDEFLNRPDRPEDFLVPDLIERQDVWMFLAGEGVGKSYLSRQLCMTLAAGVHPFHPQRRIPPQRTLLVDLENPETTVRRQSRGLHNQVVRLGDWHTDRAHLWLHPEGLNLRTPADAQLLERVIVATEPALVCFGSLYKAFLRGRDDWDTAADEVRAVLDRLRARYKIAFWLEHHMPKGDGTTRPQLPFGSSVWQRWAGYGRVLNRVGTNAWELRESFRNDRDVRHVPLGLYRGGDLPWSPIWDRDELDAARDTTRKDWT